MTKRIPRTQVTPADRLTALLAKATLTVTEANEARNLVNVVYDDMMDQMEAQARIGSREAR